mgnify:CR=1 FL=1
MSEQPSQAAGPAQDQQHDTPAPEALRPEPVESHDTTDWRAEARKWEARAKENRDAANRLQQLEDANKSETEKLTERATVAEKNANQWQTRYREPHLFRATPPGHATCSTRPAPHRPSTPASDSGPVLRKCRRRQMVAAQLEPRLGPRLHRPGRGDDLLPDHLPLAQRGECVPRRVLVSAGHGGPFAPAIGCPPGFQHADPDTVGLPLEEAAFAVSQIALLARRHDRLKLSVAITVAIPVLRWRSLQGLRVTERWRRHNPRKSLDQASCTCGAREGIRTLTPEGTGS